MADAFNTASDDIEQQRRAAVATIAQGGSTGAANFAAAQQQIAGTRTAALNAALADSAARGITPAQQQEFAGTIGRPYDLLNAASQASAASHAAQFAGTQASADNYFRQLGAAVPLARISLQAQIAAAQAKSQKELSDSQIATRLAGAGEGLQGQALDDARKLGGMAAGKVTEAEKALQAFALGHQHGSTHNTGTTGAAGPLGPQGPNGAAGPHGGLSREDIHTLAQLEKAVIDARKGRGATKQAIADVKAKPLTSYAREAGIQSGLDPNLVRGLLQPSASDAPKPAASYVPVQDAAKQLGFKPKVVQQIVNNPLGKDSIWSQGAKAAQDAIADGVPLETYMKDLNVYLPKSAKRTKALLLAVYGPAFKG